MLTSLTPSSAIALKASVTFSRDWCWLRGFLITRPILRDCRASTRAHRRTPSSKSFSKSDTTSPEPCSWRFTQFMNVFFWISIQCSPAFWERPLPSRDLAFMSMMSELMVQMRAVFVGDEVVVEPLRPVVWAVLFRC